MRVVETELPGVLVIEPKVFADARGFFLETYNEGKYRQAGIADRFVQDNHSRSVGRTLRGLHAQVRNPQGKLVRAVEGEIWDVAVDIRPASPTYRRWVGVVLSASNYRQIWVPPGFAHGFCVLSDIAQVEYKVTTAWEPGDELAIAWNDPALAIAWPLEEPPLLSDKDRQAPRLAEVEPRLLGIAGLTAELTAADRDQLAARGIDEREAERQLRLLREPPPPPRLLRPCTVGDGIRRLGPGEQEGLRAAWRGAVAGGGAVKVVPASGAATRMFRTLLELVEEAPFPTPAELARRAAAGDAAAGDLDRLWRELQLLPFFDELAAVCAARGTPLSELRERRDSRRLLRLLLGDGGLGLASLPKGLIPFHRYLDPQSGSRTAAEEHLWEGAGYLADAAGVCRYHFTVAAEARERFAVELAGAGDRLRRARGVVAEVSFSVQDPATDTLAVTAAGEPFRDEDGTLLLRPGGHGSLLGNLAGLPARWALLKNVDNVRPESAHDLVGHWQEVLGGLLVTLEQRAHQLLRRLREAATDEAVAAAGRFVADELGLQVGAGAAGPGEGRLRAELLDRLDRPLRICGVVENRGEPGGGPFWVSRQGDTGQRDAASPQIVERAEIGDDAAQHDVFGRSTHFNPVQIAAGLRNAGGHAFDLGRHVDERAVFIARKSHAGRDLLALERPGLWNGAMAGWNTVFVEVPAATFAPVKTLFDLLRPEHQ